MPRPSTIHGLPEQVREALHSWLRDPGITQTEATERVNALLEDLGLPERRVSRQAVNRYDLRMRKVGEKLRQSRQVAEAWIARLGSEPGGQLGHLVTEMLRTLAFELTLKLQEGELSEESLPEVVAQLKHMSLAAMRLERASAESVKREREIKRRAAEELADKVAAEAGSGKTVTPERLREIVKESYGV